MPSYLVCSNQSKTLKKTFLLSKDHTFKESQNKTTNEKHFFPGCHPDKHYIIWDKLVGLVHIGSNHDLTRP